MVDGARDFRLMTKQVVDSILELNEVNRFSKGIFSWIDMMSLILVMRIENELRVRPHGVSLIS